MSKEAKIVYNKHGIEAYKKIGKEEEWLDPPDWVINAMKEYAQMKCVQQREVCWENAISYDGRGDVIDAILHTDNVLDSDTKISPYKSILNELDSYETTKLIESKIKEVGRFKPHQYALIAQSVIKSIIKSYE